VGASGLEGQTLVRVEHVALQRHTGLCSETLSQKKERKKEKGRKGRREERREGGIG
jgi:hypothetical protein